MAKTRDRGSGDKVHAEDGPMPGPLDRDAEAFQAALGASIDLQRLPTLARYCIALLLVAAATVLAFAVWSLVSATNVALMYVLPVVLTAGYCGWGPALFAVVLGVLAFDFFFTEPYYSLAMTDPPEIWAAALLLVIATVVASVAANARRRALEAQEVAERAAALQALAHAVVHGQTPHEVTRIAAETLRRLFGAPCIVFLQRHGRLEAVAEVGGARSTEKDREAAQAALATRTRTRGETYPHDQTYFDFWPVTTVAPCDCVLGVDFSHATRERPASTQDLVEAVAGYVAAARGRSAVSLLPDLGGDRCSFPGEPR